MSADSDLFRRPDPPRSRKDFEVAVICALGHEADAVMEVFEHLWDDNVHRLGQARSDDNSYTAGVIAEHNVILVHMPGMGSIDAAAVAGGLRASFSELKLALVVGICGGVPCPPGREKEIYLGDLIFSTAIVQYDFGAQQPTKLERKDTLEDSHGRPTNRIRGALAKIQVPFYLRQLRADIVAMLSKTRDDTDSIYRNDTYRRDDLYHAIYLHKHRPPTNECEICNSSDEICPEAFRTKCDTLGCDKSQIIRSRTPTVAPGTDTLTEYPPEIHFGRIGSGNAVIKSGAHRDEIAIRDDLIGFEMEGVGVWNSIPTIIIKAVSDYADSHKNKDWQLYAAAVAAAGMKGFLKRWAPGEKVSEADLMPSSPQTSVIFNNHGTVGKQIGTQNIQGDVHSTFHF